MEPSATLDFRLLFITDRSLSPLSLTARVREACEAGIRAVQLREKDLPACELFGLATELREVTARYGTALIMNDRVDIALAVGADGVHCPENGFPPDRAASLLGNKGLVGASTHSLPAAQRANARGADYIIYGPVFSTASKPGEPQGLHALEKVCKVVNLPVFAVGGVTPERARACLDCGASGVAVVSALMNTRNIAHTTAEFETALGEL